jgi:hypothetical protein
MNHPRPLGISVSTAPALLPLSNPASPQTLFLTTVSEKDCPIVGEIFPQTPCLNNSDSQIDPEYISIIIGYYQQAIKPARFMLEAISKPLFRRFAAFVKR